MAKSPFFVRIKDDVLKIAACIPEGRLTTFTDIGIHLDVMPRHVAYILTTLGDEVKVMLPWHRIISIDGSLGKPKYAPDGTPQSELLANEGVVISKGAVVTLTSYIINIADLDSKVPKQVRPENAPSH
jgi:methylated-DNA-protein-cysteine methyltransferase related protein